MSKAQRGDRSFQPGAGKGDASRISDVEAFRNNYDQIDWGRRLKRAIVPILHERAARWMGYPLTSFGRGDYEDSF